MGCQDQRNFVLLIYQQLFYTCCFNTNKISKTKTRFWSHSTAVAADSLVQNQEALKYFLPVGLKYFFRNAGNIFPAWLATIHTGLDWRARKCCCQNHVGSVTTLNIWRPILLHSEKKYVPWHIYFPHHSWSNLDMGVSVPVYVPKGGWSQYYVPGFSLILLTLPFFLLDFALFLWDLEMLAQVSCTPTQKIQI